MTWTKSNCIVLYLRLLLYRFPITIAVTPMLFFVLLKVWRHCTLLLNWICLMLLRCYCVIECSQMPSMERAVTLPSTWQQTQTVWGSQRFFFRTAPTFWLPATPVALRSRQHLQSPSMRWSNCSWSMEAAQTRRGRRTRRIPASLVKKWSSSFCVIACSK